TTTSPTTTPAIIRFFIEAEDGDSHTPMEAASDYSSSAGEYVWVPNGSGNVMDPAEEGGYAEYVFDIPVVGDYVVWGRVISNDGNSDSFYASVDDGEYALWDTLQGGTETWVWDQVSDRGIADPVIFYLEMGVHTLVIKQREDGTKIDRILITNDMGYVPEGLGEEITTTTIPTPAIQKEYCSTDPTLILHGAIPEEGTMNINIPDNLDDAISASLFLTLFDPDISGEGYIYTNGQGSIDLPVGPYDNLVHSFEVQINVNWLSQGENIFRFTHVATWGYEVRGLCVQVLFASSPGTTTTVYISLPPPPPTSTTTSINPDETPPTGSVIINQGDETTNSRLVTLNISAKDDESGMGEGAQMMFSNDNIEWFEPKPFASTKLWVLSDLEGEKTVYVKFCDAEGNWMSQPVSDSIKLKLSCLKPMQLDTTALDCSGFYLPLWSEEKAVDDKTNTG
ncbi:MAG: hypothetical protein KAQ81_05355, partial [Deltaproteobacteria bacterium]|nr:hypothetical protein [Deltaproteobacteria bacterium]